MSSTARGGPSPPRWPPGTEVIGKTSDYYSSGRLPEGLGFFEGEELTVIGAASGTGRGYETRRKRDGAVRVIAVDDVVPELTKRPGERCSCVRFSLHALTVEPRVRVLAGNGRALPTTEFLPALCLNSPTSRVCVCVCG